MRPAILFLILLFCAQGRNAIADSDISLNFGAFFAGGDSLRHLGAAGDSQTSSSAPAEMTFIWHDHFTDPLGIFASVSSYGFNNALDAFLGPFAIGVQMAGIEAMSIDAGYSLQRDLSEDISFFFDLGPSFVALQNTSSGNTFQSNSYLNFGVVSRIGTQFWLSDNHRSAIAAYVNDLFLPWGQVGPAPGQAGITGPVRGNILGLMVGYVRSI